MTLEVADFGPIAEAKIDLRPLSVFVGPSNTGKSYMAILIYALSHFLRSYSANIRGRALFHAARYARAAPETPRFGEHILSQKAVESLLAWANENNLDSPTSRREAPPSADLPVTVASEIRTVLKDVVRWSQSLDDEIARCFGVEQSADLIRYPACQEMHVSLHSATARDLELGDFISHDVRISAQRTQVHASIPDNVLLRVGGRLRDRGGFSSSQRPPRVLPKPFSAGSATAIEVLGYLSSAVISDMVSPVAGYAFYLPADRAGVMDAHRVVVGALIAKASRGGIRPEPQLPTLSGVLGDFLEQLIDMPDFLEEPDETSNEISTRIEKTILRGSALLNETDTGYPSFAYRPSGWDRDVPLLTASSMVTEVAPVILYLRHVVRPGDLLIIEEPESHLHPEMQVAFTRELAAVAKAGIHVILTTHSEWVLEELANLVLLSELPDEARADFPGSEVALTPDEIGAWLFEPSGPDEGTVVKEIGLDKETGTFPSRFGLVTEDLYNRFAAISNRIEESR